MIFTVDEIKSVSDFQTLDDSTVQMMLDGVESLIRAYTHNNFQNRNIRFSASSDGNTLQGIHPFVKVGDTLQVTESDVNDGLYVVTELNEDSVVVNGDLFPVDHNLCTKVVYPADVKQGVLNLLKWEVHQRDKVGIQSETISRHAVTYFNQDTSNQVMGYPVSLMGFLKPYMKARF